MDAGELTMMRGKGMGTVRRKPGIGDERRRKSGKGQMSTRGGEAGTPKRDLKRRLIPLLLVEEGRGREGGHLLQRQSLENVLNSGSRGEKAVRLLQPVLQQRPQLAHVLEGQVERLETGDS